MLQISKLNKPSTSIASYLLAFPGPPLAVVGNLAGLCIAHAC